MSDTEFTSNNGLYRCLKSRDGHGSPIAITYNQNKTYTTACGGFLTILSTLLILVWLSTEIVKVVDRKHTITSTQELNSTAGVDNTPWNMTTSQFLMANWLLTTNKTLFPNEPESYIGRIYVQEGYLPNGTSTFTYFNATSCQNIIPEDDDRYAILGNYSCPNMTSDYLFTV